MTGDPQPPRPCVGCLGSEQCWICSGDGCHRCAASGRCHLCAPAVIRLVPPQAVARTGVASAC